jgi:2,3-dihydroxybenzoate decarboxylase
MAELDVPLYMHPRIPSPSQMRAYKGYEFLGGSPWGFGTETATHAIRLMISGLFDKHPNLRIILGHCGEGIPFSINRIDHRLRHFQSHHTPCKLRLQEYWEKNFYITTAGVIDDGTFFNTLKSCGEDRLMWSVDYPYEDYNEIGSWFDNLDLNNNSRAKIGWGNARRILKLD